MSLDSEDTVASSKFYSTDPEEIAEKLQSRIQRQMKGTSAEVNAGNMTNIMTIKLNTAPNTDLKNRALCLTLLILFPENSYTMDENIIRLPWRILKDEHVRRFRKEFTDQENCLLRLELEKTKAAQQPSPDVIAALVAKSVITEINSGFKAAQQTAERQHAESSEKIDRLNQKQLETGEKVDNLIAIHNPRPPILFDEETGEMLQRNPQFAPFPRLG